MSTDQIVVAMVRTKGLIHEYEQIIEEYCQNNYTGKRLLDSEANIVKQH